jgi:Aspartyl protease
VEEAIPRGLGQVVGYFGYHLSGQAKKEKFVTFSRLNDIEPAYYVRIRSGRKRMALRSLGQLPLAALCCLFLAPLCLGAPANEGDLKSLLDGRRWFELRDSVATRKTPVFYQGVVACAFNDLHQCKGKLGAVIKSQPRSDEAIEAHRRLASYYLIHGEYRKARDHVNAVLAIRADDSDALSIQPLLAAFSEFPDQRIAGRRPTTLQLQEGGLPFSINGVQATYWFDTGANFSVLSEAEAKRFGLQVRSVGPKGRVSTGAEVGFRIAVADRLSFGGIVVRNVEFLVFPDDQPPFKDGSPNLCFDGNNPVVQVGFNDRNLIFVLDTGATNTDLFPPFATAFPDLVRNAEKTESYQMEGVGSVRNMNAAIVQSARFVVGGFPVLLKPANVLLTPTGVTSKFFHGNLGIDLLEQAHQTIFDLKAMKLTLR